VSVADVVGSWERVSTMNTMEELDPEKCKNLKSFKAKLPSKFFRAIVGILY